MPASQRVPSGPGRDQRAVTPITVPFAVAALALTILFSAALTTPARSGAPAPGHQPPGLALEPDEAVRADLHAGQLLFSLRANRTWPMLLTAR